MAPDAAALLVVAGGVFPLPEDTIDRLGAAGLDAHRLRAARGGCPAFLASGPRGRLESAAGALERAGLSPILLDESEAASLPPLEVAGGIAPDGETVELRVHGRPAGPAKGARLLFVYGDIGRGDPPRAAEPRAGDGLQRRALRAICPVVDVVWESGRIRIPGRQMSWRGLPGVSPSFAANFLRVVETLARHSGGAVLDLGFAGQDVPIERAAGPREAVEGHDRVRASLFDRYSAAAALAWRAGLYPPSEAGTLVAVGPGVDPGVGGDPTSTLAPRSPRPAVSPVPWIRRSPGARGRPAGRGRGFGRWLLPGAPLLFVLLWLFFPRHPVVPAGALTIAAVALVVAAVTALRTRERFRAIPSSKIRSLAMGPVEIAGVVVPTALFEAPYSRTRCAWYRFEVEDRRSGAKGSDGYSSSEAGSSGDVPFRLEDETGSVLVQPAGAAVDVEPEVTPIDAEHRAREWILEEGAPVSIAGYAHRRSAMDGISGGAERNDVFVGAGPDGFLRISRRSHGEQARRLAWKAALSLAAAVFGLLLALALIVS